MTHRIRVIPSLTTLKIIQDSPQDYHSNTDALIIGNPKVDWLPPLPGARKEAEMVGRLVGVPPLVGEKATKQAVLERISSVGLIHFASHGNFQQWKRYPTKGRLYVDDGRCLTSESQSQTGGT